MRGGGRRGRGDTGEGDTETTQYNCRRGGPAGEVPRRPPGPQCGGGVAGGGGGGFWARGPRAGHSLYAAPLAQKTEAPEGWQQESVERRAGGGRRACPRRGLARAERPVFLPCPPAWDGPGCWVGTGVRARERERKNTETALVEGQTDRPAYRPHPRPSAAHPLLPQLDPEAKNKNVEKSLYRLPGGKAGAGTRALPGALSRELIYSPVHGSRARPAAPRPRGAGAQKAGSCARLRRQSMLELSGPV